MTAVSLSIGYTMIAADSSAESIIDAAGSASYGTMSYYNANVTGTGIPGNLPDPYYWWEAGALMWSLIDYWHYTGDSTYNNQVIEAMVHQIGEQNAFMPPNQTFTEGNDDQAFWAFAALSAAELKFPAPPEGTPSWIALAQAVFNTQVPRWDKDHCGGGLRWQFNTFNKGYNYKNTISTAAFFNIAARIYRYTKTPSSSNMMYTQWADKAWDWVVNIKIIDRDYNVFDGSDVMINCSQVNQITWTYNAGCFLHGAANMWNATEDPKWRARIDGMVKAIGKNFMKGNVMSEEACEPIGTCKTDQLSFKAYLTRWLAATTQLAPWTATEITPWLQESARAAAQQCSGPVGKAQCGLQWTKRSQFDGLTGLGQQMAAMNIFGANLVAGSTSPVTGSTGGTSESDPNAGTSADDSAIRAAKPVTTADKAGAAILTLLLGGLTIGGAVWLVVGA